VSAPRAEAAIRQLRELIMSETYGPGAKLPPQAELAARLGTGRSTMREAVRALSTMRVLTFGAAARRRYAAGHHWPGPAPPRHG
jgi:DNA-binding FadR family transcriptional regulator